MHSLTRPSAELATTSDWPESKLRRRRGATEREDPGKSRLGHRPEPDKGAGQRSAPLPKAGSFQGGVSSGAGHGRGVEIKVGGVAGGGSAD